MHRVKRCKCLSAAHIYYICNLILTFIINFDICNLLVRVICLRYMILFCPIAK